MQSKPHKLSFAKLKGIRKKRLLKIVILLTVLAVGLFGFWVILRFALNTESPYFLFLQATCALFKFLVMVLRIPLNIHYIEET